MGAKLKVDGVEYDTDQDFTWGELMEVEARSGTPLARDGAFDSLAVVGAFFYVVKRRSNPDLEWVEFLKEPMPTGGIEDDEDEDDGGKPKAKARPTKSAA